jgi:hypothetical protein
MAVVGAIAVILIAWLIFRSPATVVDEADGDEPIGPDTLEEEANAESEDANVGGEGTASEPQIRFDVIQRPSGDDRDHPLAQSPTIGHRLVALTGDRLITINLDTGHLAVSEVQGTPVGVAGEEVVVFDDRQGFVAVSLDNPETERRVVFSVPEIEAEESRVSVASLYSAVIEEPRILIAEFGPSTIRSSELSFVFEINLDNGTFRANVVDATVAGPPWLGVSRLGLVWVPGGGVFEAVGGVYRKLSDGFPLLMGLNYVVVSECPEPGRCQQYWIEREQGRRVERALPDIGHVFWIREIDGQARILMIDGEQRRGYFDVDRNRWLPDPEVLGFEGEGEFLGGGAEGLSSDGRWLALPVGRDVILYDLDTDARYRISLAEDVRDSRLFLVANGR